MIISKNTSVEVGTHGFIVGERFVATINEKSIPEGYLEILESSWNWIGEKHVKNGVITWTVPSGAYVENTTSLSDVSIGFWMNRGNNSHLNNSLTSFCIGSNGYDIVKVLMFWENENDCAFGSATSNGGKIINYNYKPESPYHATLIKSNNVLSLYINGELVSSDTWNISYQYSRITIGGGFWNGNFVWNEDAFQQTFPVIYPRVLTQDEIQKLYNSTKPSNW